MNDSNIFEDSISLYHGSSQNSTQIDSLFVDNALQMEEMNEVVEKIRQHLCEQYIVSEHQFQYLNAEQKREVVFAKIEALFVKLAENIVNNQPLELAMPNLRNWDNCTFNDTLSLKSSDNSPLMTTLKYNHKRSSQNFALFYFALSKIYKLLSTHEKCTKRELYYQNVNTFGSQQQLDHILNNICCFLECPIYDLNIFATSKGLVYGPLIIVTPTDQIDCHSGTGTLIPQNVCNIVALKTNAKFVLVIEKDAIFQKLLETNAHAHLPPCIFVTGKGFPDINTRLLLKKLWDFLAIPIFALVDPDPWGIEIMCVYRFGSLNMSHQAYQLAVPSLRWLGIFPTEIIKLCGQKLQLSENGRHKLADLSKRPYVIANQRIRTEVDTLTKQSFEAEIESVDGTNNFLSQVYLPHKLLASDFI